MKDIAIYALEVIVCSGILLSFYRLLLERKAGFKICRFTLLGSLALSTIIPMLQIPVWEGETVYIERTKPLVIEQAAPIPSEAVTSPEMEPIVIPAVDVTEEPFTLKAEDVVLAIYLLGVAVLLAIMTMQLLTIRRLHKSGEIVSDKNPRIIGVNEDISSFSFFNTIYISKRSSDLQTEAIIEHECSHIAHHHSLERIVMELLRAALWWNPFAWMSHKLLIETHEFEADSDVIARGFDQKQYMKTILSSILGYSPEITNGLKNSLTKKRFHMITRDKKSSHSLLRTLILIPVLAALVCTFSFTAQATHYVVQDAAPEQVTSSETSTHNTTPDVIEYSHATAISDMAPTEPINTTLEEMSQQIGNDNIPITEPTDDEKKRYSGELYSASDAGLTKSPTYDGKDFTEAVKTVRNSVRMPKESIKLGNSGAVSAKAIIETDGTLSTIKDHVFIDEYMSKELHRAIKKLKGKWQPAEIDGKKVRSLVFFVAEFYPDISSEREDIVNEPATANIELAGSEFVDAKYNGGDMVGLNEWIIANYKPYGKLADKSIHGDVELDYVITAEGKIALHQVHQMPYVHTLADQIIEFAQTAPGKITPATSNGKAIDSYNFLKFEIQSHPKGNALNEKDVLDAIYLPQVHFQGGGKDKFRDYLKENITYPKDALTWGITGRVAFQFRVQDNHIDIQFYPPYNAALANEVRRVVESSAEYWQSGDKIIHNFMCSVDFCIEQDGKLHCVIPESLKTWGKAYTNIIPPTIITGKLDPNAAPAVISRVRGEATTTTATPFSTPDNEVKADEKTSIKSDNKKRRNKSHADVVIGHPKQDKNQSLGKASVVISKITITNKNTVVRLDIRRRSAFTEVWLESNTYLKIGDKKYMIRDMMVSDNGTWWRQSAVNKKHRISSSGEISIEATFAPIPKDTRTLDFVEEGGWVIRNIILQDENIVY